MRLPYMYMVQSLMYFTEKSDEVNVTGFWKTVPNHT